MSEFTQHTIRRMTREECERTIANSFLVSADMAREFDEERIALVEETSSCI